MLHWLYKHWGIPFDVVSSYYDMPERVLCYTMLQHKNIIDI